MIILSILICTVDSRKEKFSILFQKLVRQRLELTGPYDCEILFECDNKEISVGRKRQILLERSKGTYVTFIDDDDDVANNFIEKIISTAINTAINEIDSKLPDCIGFEIDCNMEGKKEKAITSNKYSDWCEDKDGFKYCRTPYHKTPTLRGIAIQIGYKDIRFAEDYDYSKRLKESGLIKNESFINQVMYFYNYKFENPQTKYGLGNS